MSFLVANIRFAVRTLLRLNKIAMVHVHDRTSELIGKTRSGSSHLNFGKEEKANEYFEGRKIGFSFLQKIATDDMKIVLEAKESMVSK